MTSKNNNVSQLSRQAKEEAYFDNLSKTQQESWWGHKTYAGQQRLFRRAKLVIDYLSPISEDMKILEIGCGSGDFTFHLLDKLPLCNYYGIDISGGLLDKARRRITEENVKFIKGDVENMECKSEDYHAVIGVSILHHLDVMKTFSVISRLLVPGGKIIFFEPNMKNPQIWLERNIKFIGRMMQNTDDEKAFYKTDMINLLKKSGFVHISVVPFDFMHPIIPKFLVPVVDNILILFESMPVIKEIAGSLVIKGEKPSTV
ncbi:MAG: class I SAM-dependent methyltransferase [Vulcanimicrobiota bacterium]